MRIFIILILIVLGGRSINAQSDNKTNIGKVSYVSSQNIYVKFKTTNNIKPGDTLYMQKEKILVPVMVVNNLSSTSCVCTPISTDKLTVSMQIHSKKSTAKPKLEEISKEAIKTIETNKNDTSESKDQPRFKQKISGSILASTYTSHSNMYVSDINRFRYQLNLNAQNISNSKFSVESYATFRHEKGKWNIVQDDIYKALKIYNLSVKYDNNRNTQIVIGRKINPKVSSIGAVDGIQYEGKSKKLYFGAMAGSRPGYANYSFDFSLPQFGAYAGHSHTNSVGVMENTVALFEQMNNSKTDRRFAYYQHNNSLIKNLYFFLTAEVELFKNINNNPRNIFDFSSTYLSLQYKLFKKWSFSASYDNLKNVIYYETYKSYLEQMLEIEARKGLSFQVNFFPTTNLTVGVKTGYNFPNSNSKESKNLYGFVSYNNIPALKISATGSFNYLETSYVNGKIYNLNIHRDFFKGKLYAESGYQIVDYRYPGIEPTSLQHILNMSISWRLINRISLSANYEKTFEKQDRFSRLNLQIRKRF